MSTLKIEERIVVSAPPARVWKFLLDPARVAACLPGAKLDGTEGDATFLGTMKVKVGPVMMEFKGKATMSDVVEAERRVTLTGTGNDKSGGGSAKMEMKSQILDKDGGSEIVVIADVDLAGKLVRFGRGMMEGISKQMFKQFSERVQTALANEPEEEPAAPEAKEEEPARNAEEAPKVEEANEVVEAAEKDAGSGVKIDESSVKIDESSVKIEPSSDKSEASGDKIDAKSDRDGEKSDRDDEKAREAAEEAKPVEATPAKPEAKPAKKAAAPGEKKAAPLVKKDEDEALDAGSLVWAAIWEWIKGLFRRLFGRGR
jgi:carbon monoxide dehydrogenase subunit G